MKYKIYYLSNPLTNEIRYVGRTSQTLRYRLNKHLNAKDKSHRVNWIASLKRKGLTPNIKLICETNDFETCKELEIFYIKKYYDNDYKLTNMTDGGEGSVGFNHSTESKLLMSASAKKRMSNPSVIKNLSENAKKKWKNKTKKEKLNNILNQPNRKNIGQFDLNHKHIETYISLREIERELGFFRANISPCIKGEFKQAYGFIWKYVD